MWSISSSEKTVSPKYGVGHSHTTVAGSDLFIKRKRDRHVAITIAKDLDASVTSELLASENFGSAIWKLCDILPSFEAIHVLNF